MTFVDTHSHIYLEEFDKDRDEVVKRALGNGVEKILLPNIDRDSVALMHVLTDRYPDLFKPMIGLHPTSVKEDFRVELKAIEELAATAAYCAIGEVGIDLYWDTTFKQQQEYVFAYQLQMAAYYKLPVVIHCRNSMKETIDVIKKENLSGLKGVFHCFSGDVQDASDVIEMGFHIGVGGVVTYKKSLLVDVVKSIPLDKILLETDSPYLPPVPYRGERNESSYIPLIAAKIAEIKNTEVKTVAEVTTESAFKLFNL